MKPSDFTIELRVRVREARPITGIDEQQTTTLDGVRLSVQLQPPILRLAGSGFATEEKAKKFLPKLICGLWNVAIKHDLAFTPVFDRLDVYRPKDPGQAAKNSFGTGEGAPTKVDGLVSGEGYFIRPTIDRICHITGGDASVYVSSSWESVKHALLDGIGNGALPNIAVDRDVHTALDLYASSFRENTLRARFITLVSCLEVLAPQLERHKTAVDMFKEFEDRLKDRLCNAADDEEREAIQSVLCDTRWKKEASISEQIRQLIRSAANGTVSERDTYVRRVIKAYNIRSKLLHKGAVDPSKLGGAALTVRNAVKLVLTKRLGLS